MHSSATAPPETVRTVVLEPLPVVKPTLPVLPRHRTIRRVLNPALFVPLFYAALLYMTGIALAHFQYFRPGLLLAGLLPITAIAILAIIKATRLIWLPIAALWLVLGIWSAETESAPAANPAVLQLSDGLLRTVEGSIVSTEPLRSEATDTSLQDSDPITGSASPAESLQRIDLQLDSAEVITDTTDAIQPIPQTPPARIRVTLHWPVAYSASGLRCGQRIRAVLRMLPPDTFHDPGVWSLPDYLASQQVSATAILTATQEDGGVSRLSILSDDGSNSPVCCLNQLRNNAATRLESLPALTRSLPLPLRASPEDAAMLTALLTGDRTFLTRGLRAGFERTGSFHLIVVSGLHLAILAGWVLALARRLRLPRFAATALTLAVTFGYALFTGFAIPAQRSFWMIALYLLGRLFYRNRSPLNAIGFAALCLAAASPHSIFDASLQMTLIAVAAITGIAAPLLEHTLQAWSRATRDLGLISLDPKLPPQIAQFRVTLRLIARHLEPATSYRIAWKLFPLTLRTLCRLGELLFVTFTVELALALPMTIYFHRITVFALPINLLILPLLTILVPAAMLLLLTLLVFSAAAPIFAAVPAAVCLGLLHFSLFLVRALGNLSLADFRIPDPAPWQVAAALILFVLALQLARQHGRRQPLQRRLAFVALAAMAATALWPRPVGHPTNALLFEAIDVGQGDSLLLITPDGKTLLIDGGGIGLPFLPTTHPSHSEFDVGEEVVSAALWARGIRRLDAVALTHAHHDHMGGLPAILRNFRPRELWVGSNPPVPTYTSLLSEASSLGVQIRSLHTGQSIVFGDALIHVFAPQPGYSPGPQPANNDSLVLRARYGATSVLLAGDAEAPEERSILTEFPENPPGATAQYRADPDLHSTVLKIGHHGSLTSTRPDFLAAVEPRWAVISCGRHNRFGHPRPEILEELQSAHIHTLRTDIEGAACLLLDGKSVHADPLCLELPEKQP